jgi:trafficking protein particle complex subunit 10
MDLSSINSNDTEAARTVAISVPVPRMQVLHTVTLDLFKIQSSASYSPPIVAVGQMIMGEIKISHTRQWDSESALKKAANIADAQDPLDFTFEIGANPDIWLIGGQRRMQFSARESEELSFPLVLIPLRQGIWLLPSIEVRPMPPRQDDGQQQLAPRGPNEELICEVDYQSQAETIQVISNLRSTTVGIAAMAQPGMYGVGTVLLDSEPRKDIVSGEDMERRP